MQSHFRIIKKDIDVDFSSKVIKKEVFAEAVDAGSLIEHARKLGETLILEAHVEAEGIRKKAFEEAKKAGQKEVAKEIFTVRAQIEKHLQKTEASIADMVETCIRKLLGELGKEELLALLVKKSLESLEKDNKVKLRVNPHTIDAFEVAIDSFAQHQLSEVEISVDESIAPEECLIEYNLGFMIVRAHEQVETVISIMRETMVLEKV